MAISFPLYDSLLASVSGVPDWKNLSPVINNLTPEQCEIIFALMIHHYTLEQTARTGIPRSRKDIGIPYGGKTFEGGKGLLYTANSIPLPLQQIIFEYTKQL